MKSCTGPFCIGLAAVAAAGILGCTTTAVPVAECPDPRHDPIPERVAVLATVNGVPIGEDEVRLALERVGHQRGELTPERQQIALETLIRDELIYQRAVELQLDDDGAYRASLRAAEVRLRALQREELGDVFWDKAVAAAVTVTEDEARAEYEANAERYQTEHHVYQLLIKDEAAIEEAHARLLAGESFEAVYRARYPNLPVAAGQPWDLGYLHWSQVPEPWHEVLPALEVGATSDVIRGPGGRFWVIQLLDRRVDPAVTFEGVRPMIEERLAAEKLEAARAETEQSLRAAATIEYFDPPPPDPSRLEE